MFGVRPGPKFGLWPIDIIASFTLEKLSVDVNTRRFLAGTRAVFRYKNTETSATVPAKFVFPYAINELAYIVSKISAEITDDSDPNNDVTVEMDVEDLPETQAEVNKLNNDPCAHYLSRDFEHLQFVVGPVPPAATVEVTLQFVCHLCDDPDGSVSYQFPDVLTAGGPDTDVEVTVSPAASNLKLSSTRDDITWTFDRAAKQMTTTFTSNQTDFDVKGMHAWDLFANGHMSVDYEDAPEDVVEDGQALLGVSVSTPHSGTGPMASISKDVEVIFVVDRSGSMNSTDRIDHAKETLLLFLKSLPVGCYFNVVGFGSSYETLFTNGTVEYNGDTLKTAVQHQQNMRANLGGTNLLTPLAAILGNKPRKGFSRILFVMTDGQVGSDQGCINLAKKHAGDTRIFTFGIGTGVSRAFIENLSKASGASHEFTTTNDRDMESKVMKTMQSAMSCSGFRLKWKINMPKGLKVEDIDDLPSTMSPGRRRTVFLKVEGKVQGKGKGKCTLSVDIESDERTVNHSCIFNPETDKHLSDGTGDYMHSVLAFEESQETMKNEYVNSLNAKSARGVLESYNLVSLHSALVTSRIPKDGSEKTKIGYSNIVIVGASLFGGTAAAPAANAFTTGGLFNRGAARQPRRRKILRDNLSGITNSTIKRIGRRGGIMRFSSLTYEEIRGCLKQFLEKIVGDCVTYADHSRRRCILEEDVDKSLKKNGIKMYGIEDYAPYIFESNKPRKRRRVAPVYKRTTPFNRPNDTTSVGSLLGVTRNDVTSKLTKKLSKQASTASSKSTGKGSMKKQSTVILQASTSDGSTKAPSRTVSKAPSLTRKRTSASAGSAPAKQPRTDPPAPPAPAVGKGRGAGKGKAPAPRPLKPARTSTRNVAAKPGAVDFQAMITMITMQQFDGHWSLSGDLAKVIKKPLADLTAAPLKNLEVWATALAITWLNDNFSEQRMEWEMIHYKALKFMEGHDLEGHSVVDLQKKAAAML